MPSCTPAASYSAAESARSDGSTPGSARRCVDTRISDGFAADVRAVAAQHLELVDDVLGRAARVVPVLGEAGDAPQRAALAEAADADRRVRALDRLGLAAGVLQRVVLPGEVRRGVGQQPDDDLERLVEAVEALLQRRQVDAVGRALLLVPTGAEAELEAALRHDVDRGGHVREHRRVAVHVAGDEHSHPHPLGRLGQRGERGPALRGRGRSSPRRSDRSGRTARPTPRSPSGRPPSRPRGCPATRCAAGRS